MNLKLQEVIWEVTGRCDKNCDYCGSKDILNASNELTHKQRLKIAENLVEYGVETVNLSGGEPGMLPANELFEITSLLKTKCKTVSVITNGKALYDCKFKQDIIAWMNYVDSIGISINTENDCKVYESKFPSGNGYRDKCVMVTNFGTHNIWQFEKLRKFAVKHFPVWQVQLTMGKYLLPDNAIKMLYDNFATPISGSNQFMVVYADNLQRKHDCMAGIKSCGITYDGNVVACLAERSFQEHTWHYYGNLFQDTLQDIWENGFKDIRFEGKCRSCRNQIKYPDCISADKYDTPIPFHIPPTIYPMPKDDFLPSHTVMMYACFIRPQGNYEIEYHIETPDTSLEDLRKHYGIDKGASNGCDD